MNRRRRLDLLSRIFCISTVCLTAASSSGSSSSNSNGEEYEYNKKGKLDVQPFCRRNYIKTTSLWLTCDTPGAYYYGSNAYRNSEVCMSSDKANLEVDFVIPNGYQDQAIGLNIECGLYNQFQTVVMASNICQDLTIISNSGNECPNAGYFTLRTYFQVPALRDYSFHYTPDIKLTFVDSSGQRVGCATTGTVAMHRAAHTRAQHGLIALGVSVVAFCVVFGLLLLLSYRRKKRLEQRSEERRQNFHYFRTLPTGQVVPLPGAALPTVRETSPVPAETLNISNPSYNEPQIPTRPII